MIIEIEKMMIQYTLMRNGDERDRDNITDSHRNKKKIMIMKKENK